MALQHLPAVALRHAIERNEVQTFGAIIIGSGYGGAAAALRLAQAGVSVLVLERGQAWLPGDFPETLGEVAGTIQLTAQLTPDAQPNVIGNPQGLYDIRVYEGLNIIAANALGGGSQINAGVALRMPLDRLQHDAWPQALRDDPASLEQAFAQAEAALQASPYPAEQAACTAKTINLKKLAEVIDGASFDLPPLTIRHAHDAQAPAPGECLGCGQCATGCNAGAKLALTDTYLARACEHGATLVTQAQVVGLAQSPRQAQPDSHGDTQALPLWDVQFIDAADTAAGTAAASISTVRARWVIVAAGALGSTELLFKARAQGLAVSEALGSRFSTNGDAISVGYWQTHAVHGVVDGDLGLPASFAPAATRPRIGPTITGVVRARTADQARVYIEDSSVPRALAHYYGEIVTTAAMIQQQARDGWVGDTGATQMDPLTINPLAIAHSGTYLCMGEDPSLRTLVWQQGGAYLMPEPFATADAREPAQTPDTPNALAQSLQYVRSIDEVLKACEKLGGIYLPNPITTLVPAALAPVVGQALTDGMKVTVHPLGGCPMGDDGQRGVVDHLGRVFADQQTLHNGLLVLDGSIVPMAIGANPFLTITALAERAMTQLLSSQHPHHLQTLRTAAPGFVTPAQPSAHQARPKPQPHAQAQRVEAVFSETLHGCLDGALGKAVAASLPQALLSSIDLQAQRWPVRLDLDLMMTGQAHLHAMLRDAEHRIPIRGTLYLGGQTSNGKPSFSAQASLPPPADQALAVAVAGDVRLLVRDTHRPMLRALIKVLRAYRREQALTRRWPGLMRRAAYDQAIKQRRNTGKSWLERLRQTLGFLIAYRRVLTKVSEPRLMHYQLQFRVGDTDHQLAGSKRLSYADGGNPWLTLLNLPMTWSTPGLLRSTRAQGTLAVALDQMVERGFLRITQQPDSIVGLSALASLSLFSTRALLQSQLLNLRAPHYPDVLDPTVGDNPDETAQRHAASLQRRAAAYSLVTGKPAQAADLPVRTLRRYPVDVTRDRVARGLLPQPQQYLGVRSNWVSSDPPMLGVPDDPALRQQALFHHNRRLFDWHALGDGTVPAHLDTVDTTQVLLTRYPARPADANGSSPGAVVLFHGFGYSSLVYATDAVDTCLLDHFHQQGFDVWLADFRTSIAHRCARKQWSYDLVALQDIPALLQKVYDLSNGLDPLADDASTAIDVQREPGKPPQKIKVFAHCGGSAGLFMAASQGLVRGLIDRVVSTQASLFMELEPLVRARALGLRAANRVWQGGVVSTRVDAETASSALQTTFDRLASTYPYQHAVDANHGHDPDAVDPSSWVSCNRSSLMWGEHWLHQNIGARLHNQLDELFGLANLTTVRQISEFGLAGRIVPGETETLRYADDVLLSQIDFAAHLVASVGNRFFKPIGMVRSHQKLRELGLQRDGYPLPFQLSMLPGYGHLDPILGEHAARDVFGPYFSSFLRHPLPAVQPAQAPPRWQAIDVRTGPVLRGVQRFRTLLKVTVWLEKPHHHGASAESAVLIWTLGARRWVVDEHSTRRVERDGHCVAITCALPVDAVLQCKGRVSLQVGVLIHRPDLATRKRLIPLALQHPRDSATRAMANIAPWRQHPAMSLGQWLGHSDAADSALGDRQAIDQALTTLPAITLGGGSWLDLCAAAPKPIALALGSCRFDGTPFESALADQAFKTLLTQHAQLQTLQSPLHQRESRPLDLLMMLGDQIYADVTAALTEPGSSASRYDQAYRATLIQHGDDAASHRTALGELLARVPCLQAVDDHEFRNDYDGKALQDKAAAELRLARRAMHRYQLLGMGAGVDRRWYEYRVGAIPMFMMDTRYERQAPTSTSGGRLIGPQQRQSLLNWLSRHQHCTAPLIIASGSVLAPIPKAAHDHPDTYQKTDGWTAFSDDTRAILHAISQHRGGPVLLLAGDHHCHSVSDVIFTDAQGQRLPLTCVSIVSSGFYAPLPFANFKRDDLLDHAQLSSWPDAGCTDLAGEQVKVSYQMQRFEAANGFIRVDASPWAEGAWDVKISWYGVDGKPGFTLVR